MKHPTLETMIANVVGNDNTFICIASQDATRFITGGWSPTTLLHRRDHGMMYVVQRKVRTIRSQLKIK